MAKHHMKVYTLDPVAKDSSTSIIVCRLIRSRTQVTNSATMAHHLTIFPVATSYLFKRGLQGLVNVSQDTYVQSVSLFLSASSPTLRMDS